MITTQYTVTTPYGTFVAMWDENEEIPVVYSGNEEAVAFFKSFLALKTITGQHGSILTFEDMEPADLYGFCQFREYGILVFPEVDDLLSIRAEATADSAEPLEQPQLFLDSVGITDDPKDELLSLLEALQQPGEGPERVAMAQRLVELIPQVVFDTPEQEEAAVTTAASVLEDQE